MADDTDEVPRRRSNSRFRQEVPPDLRRVLTRKVPVLNFLSVSFARPLFYTSRRLRTIISSHVAILVHFTVVVGETLAELEEAKWRIQQFRVQIWQESMSGPLPIYFRCPSSELPLQHETLVRNLQSLAPMVRWEECREMHFICRAEHIASMDPALRPALQKIYGCQPWMMEGLEQVWYMEVTLSQICGFPSDTAFPTISTAKVVCCDPAAASDGSLLRIYSVFPNLKQLHLHMRPNLLPPMCLSNFVALADFRISFDLAPGTLLGDGVEGSFFMAANLLNLPFSCEGGMFQHLQRLQMNLFLRGGLEPFARALRSQAPSLKRLGTTSLQLLRLLEVHKDSFKLEEVVVVMEIEDSLSLFNMLLPLSIAGNRCSLKRLGLHMQAPDGLLPPHEEVEGFLCSGFLSLTDCLAENSFIHFTQSHAQLVETVFFQLPYVAPEHFSADLAACGSEGPQSTPLERPLRLMEALPSLRPSGTLISGQLRPSMAELASQKPERHDLHAVLPENMQMKLMHVIDSLGNWKEEMGFRS